MSNQVINPSTGMQEMVFSLNSEEDLHNALVEGDKYYRRQRIVPVKVLAQQLMAIAASFLKPGEVTMLRVHYDSDGYQLIVMNGKVLDTKAQFNGFSGKVQMKAPVDTLVDQFVENGYESHFALVYGDYAQALSNLAKMLGIPLMKY